MNPLQLIGATAGGIAALGTLGLGAVGNTLYDFALNPRAKRSMAAQICAGEAVGLDGVPFTGDPQRDEARAWFEQARQSVQIDASDGGKLFGWAVFADGVRVEARDEGRLHRGADAASHLYGILCHGYVGRPADLALEAQLAHREGISVLLPAARGHERNGERDITMGWRDADDLLGWIDLICSFDPEARIALYGVSMGGAEVMMASGLALPAQVRCIVEDCGYTSVWDEFAFQMGNTLHLPVSPLLDVANMACRARAGWGFKEASAVERLRAARVPMLFIHGSADAFVPFWMHGRVFEACASPVKEALVIEGAGHALASATDPDRYWRAVSGFMGYHLAQ